jgi:peptidoglycan/LPS O-acetylase OafA/YrhL
MTTPTQGAKPGYNRALDLARFVAALGIVWDHARAPYADVGYTALALFLILASFLGMGSYERSGGPGFWASRARRIAVPWLFWCAVYRIVYEVVSDAPFALLAEPFTLLIGPSIHLWFLPFDMIALLAIPYLSRWLRRPLDLARACGLLVVVALPLGWLHADVGISGWFIGLSQPPQPLPQWYYSAPIFLYGAVAAAGHRLGLIWMPLATAAVISAVLFVAAPEFASLQMILAALVFEVIWRVKITGVWPTRLASFAFGIYLLHPAFMLVAFKAFGPDVDRSLAALFTFFAAWAATAMMQRLPIFARFV